MTYCDREGSGGREVVVGRHEMRGILTLFPQPKEMKYSFIHLWLWICHNKLRLFASVFAEIPVGLLPVCGAIGA